jgi:hypothetical protein
MKNILINSLIIVLTITNLNAQINLARIDYGYHSIARFENNLNKYQEVEISTDLETEIANDNFLENIKSNKPIFYFRKLIYTLQSEKGAITPSAQILLNDISTTSISEFCDCETRDKKSECANFSKALKKFALKLQMFDAFYKKNKAVYCEIYPKYKIDVAGEHIKYQNEISPEGRAWCAQVPTEFVDWYKMENDIIIKFIEFDYYISQGKTDKAMYILRRITNNNVLYLDEHKLLEELLAKRIARYILKEGIRKTAKDELEANISDFLNNEKAIKGIFYRYNFNVTGIPISLNTFLYEQQRNEQQIERLKQSLPAKTKEEIVQEFKQTALYKIITDKKYLKNAAK